MNLLVGGEVGLGAEVLAAGAADVLGLPVVQVVDVGLQAAEVAELLLAEVAVERLAGFCGKKLEI